MAVNWCPRFHSDPSLPRTLRIICLGIAALLLWRVCRGPASQRLSAPNPATLLVADEQLVQDPHQTTAASDATIAGGPPFILCGCADLQHHAWFGSEETGVYEYADGNWKKFDTSAGVGENGISAIACDGLGRIWAGHVSSGVSIYNGKDWKTYDRLTGLGGSHVFCICTCPTDGDVWLATEMGLTRYSLKHDTWSYYDRSTGMPAGDVSSMAFDSSGNLYAGLAANGVAVAHAGDNYQHWSQTKGPDSPPNRASGGGLPTNLVNAMLVTRDNTVYAGTSSGLACSTDGGVSWAYVRGKNWPAYAEGSFQGMPDDFDFGDRGELAEDWIERLAQDPFGVIWIGYQSAGYQTFLPVAATADHAVRRKFVTAIVPLGDGKCLLGTYGGGTCEAGVQYNGTAAAVPPAPASSLAADAFPTPAPVPDASALDILSRKLQALPPGGDDVQFLPDDWETGGDWVGSYGNQAAVLFGFKAYHTDSAYNVAIGTGPWRSASMRYYWDDKPQLSDDRLLLDPDKKKRIYTENNDESYDEGEHPRTQQGPDLFIRLRLPQGLHRISLFFQNHDAHNRMNDGVGTNGQRDFIVEVKKPPIDDEDDDQQASYNSGRGYYQLQPIATTEAELAPVLAQSRVSWSHDGVYKRLLIRGAGDYWIKLDRNHSPCLKVSAVFVDRLDKPSDDKPWFGVKYQLQPGTDYTADQGVKGAASKLWALVQDASDRDPILAERARIAAYRAAAANGADEDTLSAWRQKMFYWVDPDRDRFDEAAGLAPAPGL